MKNIISTAVVKIENLKLFVKLYFFRDIFKYFVAQGK